MKYIFILLAVLLMGNESCQDINNKLMRLKVGDKFTYQGDVDIARSDSDVVVYRWHYVGYYYFSTTRKDSIIYNIRSVVK